MEEIEQAIEEMNRAQREYSEIRNRLGLKPGDSYLKAICGKSFEEMFPREDRAHDLP